jgi:tetratricopeptide (TPR) repeat protein
MSSSPDRRAIVRAGTTLFITLLLHIVGGTSAGEPTKPTLPPKLLVEARTIASFLPEQMDRSSALESILLAQISLDPGGARETLKSFSDLPNKTNHFASLALAYAEEGNIDDTERMYAEIRIEDRSSRQGKLAAANARGYVAVAYANAGKIEDAFRILSQLREQFKETPPASISVATAAIAEAQVKYGDITGAVQTAVTIASENPFCLMNIVGGRVRDRDMQGALQIVSQLEEGLQPYAQWGIVRAQKEQGRLTEAQLTASAIKPGHAKASALLELANHHLRAGAKSIAAGLLQEASTAAASTANQVARSDVVWHIAAAMAEAGETFTAIETATSIETDGQRRSAIRDIVSAQAKQGDVKGAFNTALLLKHGIDADRDMAPGYESAVGDILVELTKSGRAKEAKETVRTIEDFRPRHRLLYARIVSAQADSGDIQGAKVTFLLVESPQQRGTRKKELSRLMLPPREYLSEEDLRRLQELSDMDSTVRWALEAIAKAQARRGDLHSAVTTADDLTQPSHRASLIQAIGATQVQSGHTQSALIWARALPSPSDKAHALVGIAQALSTPKSKPAAKR